jgi:hypothetical protein
MTDSPLRRSLSILFDIHRPSRSPFFAQLGDTPREYLLAEGRMDRLYLAYQGAMHASRTMGYFMPHLDRIDRRMVKLAILADDDGAPNGDSHHYQLRRAWTLLLGRPPNYSDEAFGRLDLLAAIVDPATARFVGACSKLYPQSLGPWLMVEGLAHDWIGALMKSLGRSFPGVERTDYFLQNYFNEIELEHMQRSIDTVESVLSERPELFDETIIGAQAMGREIDLLWLGLKAIVD